MVAHRVLRGVHGPCRARIGAHAADRPMAGRPAQRSVPGSGERPCAGRLAGRCGHGRQDRMARLHPRRGAVLPRLRRARRRRVAGLGLRARDNDCPEVVRAEERPCHGYRGGGHGLWPRAVSAADPGADRRIGMAWRLARPGPTCAGRPGPPHAAGPHTPRGHRPPPRRPRSPCAWSRS